MEASGGAELGVSRGFKDPATFRAPKPSGFAFGRRAVQKQYVLRAAVARYMLLTIFADPGPAQGKEQTLAVFAPPPSGLLIGVAVPAPKSDNDVAGCDRRNILGLTRDPGDGHSIPVI
jgi:hypothetical protein